MIIPPYQYWGTTYGRLPGEVQEDKEGIQTMVHAARDMAWLMKVLEYGKDIPRPNRDPREITSFVR
ncbi:hypothetical protein [Anaerosporobacter sp.]